MRDTRYKTGSALILAVVLTSLLAIVGVMFLMVGRVDRTATSAISENRELNFAVETVVALVSQVLASDVPRPGGPEYYDYPGEEDKWLASLEPYDSGGYKWRQISDVYSRNFPSQGLQAVIVPDYQVSSQIGDSNNSSYYRADADGDGVADSVWVRIPEMTSNKGKPIYAAIRVVDNGGMLNVNTAYKFDPNASGVTASDIDGSSQTQINLAELSQRGVTNGSLATAADKLQAWRCGTEPNDLSLYEQNVVWQYYPPAKDTEYTPFDISDELKLRNRYILNYNLMVSRIEELWEKAYDWGLKVPRNKDDHPLNEPNNWFARANNSSADLDMYDYRHISTTYNMDRIIDPNGEKMLNINDPFVGVSILYGTINKALRTDPNFVDVNDVAAQIAVNLIDFRDTDPNVTPLDVDGKTYYGFEQPCVYISELAHRFVEADVNISPKPSAYKYLSYAIELHKPYLEDDYPEPNQWQLSIEGYPDSPIRVDWSGTQHFHVMLFEHPNAPMSAEFDLNDYDPDFDPCEYKEVIPKPATVVFSAGKMVSLERLVGGDWITVDSVMVPDLQPGGWLEKDGEIHSYQRDITLHKCIRRLWDDSFEKEASATLGSWNEYKKVGDLIYIQAHPYLDPLIYPERGFRNIGEIGTVFRKPAYYEASLLTPPSDVIGYDIDSDEEAEVRLDLTDPSFQQLFKYLTIFDPTVDGIDNDGDGDGTGANEDPNELKIPGRININTAPWYVMAQLPWMTPDIAQDVASYRDNHNGFESIGELMDVAGIDFYASDGMDQLGFPDLTPGDSTGDEAPDDFEERDVIFSRISNLVTVRSDVFTAYILVRIGTDGPQKRAIAILDRSNVYSGGDKVRIIALHPVADPR